MTIFTHTVLPLPGPQSTLIDPTPVLEVRDSSFVFLLRHKSSTADVAYSFCSCEKTAFVVRRGGGKDEDARNASSFLFYTDRPNWAWLTIFPFHFYPVPVFQYWSGSLSLSLSQPQQPFPRPKSLTSWALYLGCPLGVSRFHPGLPSTPKANRIPTLITSRRQHCRLDGRLSG